MATSNAQADAFFDALCVDYYDPVYFYLLKLSGDDTLARDCLQDTFLVALGRAAELMDHPNPGGFLFRTAKLTFYNKQRAACRRLLREEALEGADEAAAQEGDGVLEAMDRAVDVEDYVEAVLARLDEDKLRLYRLYFIDGVGVPDLARQYGTTEGALRMRISRLRGELRAMVGELAETNFS